ncbi:MAG TPA: nickel-dependent hydrogenase large subunit [Burkholderiales bacterium]|nr:nickel-dependent hydrogenase large subunit [Burkholderiales bacterium]
MSYTIPIGPYHPALEEPYKVNVQCGGDTVQAVSVEVGYSFRGIELLAQRTGWVQDLTLIERVCGICSHTHTTTFCRAVETLAEIEVPARAVYIRTAVLELERLHSHLLWVGLASEYIGFQSLFMEAFNLRERVMDLLESISGNRVHYGMNRIGGVNRDITDPDPIVAQLRAMGEIVERDIVPSLTESPTAMSRMRGVGVLTAAQAIEWGVIGPVARASGIATDVRSDLPYGFYPELGFKIVTQTGGDVLARVAVRALEVLESIRLVCAALQDLPPGPIRAFEGMPDIPAGEATAFTEAPRGEAIYYVASDGGATPARVKIRTPSFVNIPALEAMTMGQQFGDVPLIQASVDPCLSCTDR